MSSFLSASFSYSLGCFSPLLWSQYQVSVTPASLLALLSHFMVAVPFIFEAVAFLAVDFGLPLAFEALSSFSSWGY
jgi:hypothetical protein